MSELIDRQALKDAVRRYAGEPIKAKDKKCQAICLDMLGTIDAQPTASPWHRVEEPPKEEGRYLFAVRFDGHWIFDAAWYTHDISTVIDVTCCERVGGFYKGNTEVHPDYWMPIEPPKEVQE